MPNTPRKIVVTAVRFLGLLLLLYGVALFVVANVRVGGYTVARILTQDMVEPLGHSDRRFAELERHGDVDLVFVGSSHAYRSFDPRIFDEAGLSSFNLGSTAQTPLNSYYLLKRYWPLLAPSVVVIETYYHVMDKDGLESLFDLAANVPPSREWLQMALATRNPHAVNSLLAYQLQLRDASGPASPERGTYVRGGYVETQARLAAPRSGIVAEVGEIDRQLRYLGRCIDFVKRRGARVAVVVQPLPDETLAGITNRRAVSEAIGAVAAGRGVPFADFNGRLGLKTTEHFMDTHHLNAAGVRRFNLAVLDLLREHALID